MTSSPKTSLLRTLMSLPAVFDIDQYVAATGQERSTVRIALNRAHDSGDIAPAGPRSGIYYNLVVDPVRNVEAAVRIGIPSAIIIGPSALHWHSATSQRSHLLTLAWLKNNRTPYMASLNDVISVPRSLAWYQAIAGHTTEGPGGIPVLSAAMAIADMRMNGGPGDVPVLDEDDLDLDDADIEEADIEEAMLRFGFEPKPAEASMSKFSF